MDDGSTLPLIGGLIALLALSAFFSACETALTGVSPVRVQTRAEAGNKRARALLRLLDDFDRVDSALVVCNDIVNITIATLTTLLATSLWGESAVAATTIVTTVVVFLLGESLPKFAALSSADAFSLRVTHLVGFLNKALYPIVFVINKIAALLIRPFREEDSPSVTEEELESLIDTATEEGAIDEDTGELVQSAFDLGRTTAAQILTPWEEVTALRLDQSPESVLETVRQTPHSRLPVVDSLSRPLGFLRIRRYIPAYLASQKEGRPPRLRPLLDRPHWILSTDFVDDLLPRMSGWKTTAVFVRNPEGKLLGILTMEDILEELVGEIYDENDPVLKGGEPS